MVGMPADLSCSNMRPLISQQCPLNPDSTTQSERPAGQQAADYTAVILVEYDKGKIWGHQQMPVKSEPWR